MGSIVKSEVRGKKYLVEEGGKGLLGPLPPVLCYSWCFELSEQERYCCLLEDGDAEGGSDDFSTIKESWMIMDGTLSATNNGGEEEYKTESAAVVMAASGFSTLATGSSDTADKIKPFVEREKCLTTAETWSSTND